MILKNRFLGAVNERDLIGVELEENLGNSDGTFMGKKYFHW